MLPGPSCGSRVQPGSASTGPQVGPLSAPPRGDGCRMPDIGAAAFRLPPLERELVLQWCEDMGVDLEAAVALRSAVEAVVCHRLARGMPGGSWEARYAEAGVLLGIDGEKVRRKLDYWRARSGKNLREVSVGTG